jgi:hypothetical protein
MSFRPARKIFPTAKLTADNAGELELTSHRRAIASVTATSAAASSISLPPKDSSESSSLLPCPSLPPSSPPPTDTDDATDSLQVQRLKKRPSQAISSSLSTDSIIILSLMPSDHAPNSSPEVTDTARTAKRAKVLPSQKPSPVLADSSIIDINDIDDPRDEQLNKSDATADIRFFFAPVTPEAGQKTVTHMRCKTCT